MQPRRAVAAALLTLWAMAVLAAQTPEPRFDVVSIKRNTSNRFVPGPAGSGVYWMSNGTPADMVLRAYPTEAAPPEFVNLPDWAKSERYDVLAKGKGRASADEQQQMWRALLADRLNLQAHYQPRQQQGYRLVFARTDQRLAPALKPSTLDCTEPQPFPTQSAVASAQSPEVFGMGRCGFMMVGTPAGPRAVSGGAPMAALARLLSGFVQRPVVDGTGLDGYYAIAFTHTGTSSLLATTASDGPSVFVAVEEQLALKLQPATVTVQAIVIDHIERPTEN